MLARIGVGSRRDVEACRTQKRIKVNGVEATLGQRVDLHDAITIDGKVIKREEGCRIGTPRHHVQQARWQNLHP